MNCTAHWNKRLVTLICVYFITLFIYWPSKRTVIHTSHAIQYEWNIPRCTGIVLGCANCARFHATFLCILVRWHHLHFTDLFIGVGGVIAFDLVGWYTSCPFHWWFPICLHKDSTLSLVHTRITLMCDGKFRTLNFKNEVWFWEKDPMFYGQMLWDISILAM